MGTNFHTAFSNTAPKTAFTKAAMGLPISDLDRAITYNRVMLVGRDGTITWSAGSLTWSGTLHIYFNSAAGLSIHNSIAAGNIALSDSEFAYVTLSETNNAVVTVSKAALGTNAASGFLAYNRFILGYRNASDDVFYPDKLAGIMQTASASSGFTTPIAKTIASGAFAVTGTNSFHAYIVDTEGAAASDDLTGITGGVVGELCKLQCTDGARVVVCKKGTPLRLQGDFTLNNIYDRLVLECVSSGVWVEISRASNS
jgi:hypothetical protein